MSPILYNESQVGLLPLTRNYFKQYYPWLPASSTGHFCNEDRFSRCYETKCMQWALVHMSYLANHLSISEGSKDREERIFPTWRSQSMDFWGVSLHEFYCPIQINVTDFSECLFSFTATFEFADFYSSYLMHPVGPGSDVSRWYRRRLRMLGFQQSFLVDATLVWSELITGVP